MQMTERFGWLKYFKVLALAGLTVLAACGDSTPTTTTAPTPKASYLEVLPTGMSYSIGTTYQYRVILNQFDGGERIVDVTAEATWTTDNAAVATVSSSGVVTAVAAGDAVVTATRAGMKGSAAFRVTPDLESIAVSPATPAIAVEATAQFAATATFSDETTAALTTAVKWTSSATTVATVDEKGLATAIAPGQTTIKATCQTASVCGELSGDAVLTVSASPLVSIAVTSISTHVIAGNTQQLTATGTYADNTVQNITALATWTSDATSVATVGNEANNKGLARAVSGGNANISAALGTINASLRLTAYPPAQ